MEDAIQSAPPEHFAMFVVVTHVPELPWHQALRVPAPEILLFLPAQSTGWDGRIAPYSTTLGVVYTSTGVCFTSVVRGVAGGPLLPVPADSLTRSNSGAPVTTLALGYSASYSNPSRGVDPKKKAEDGPEKDT